MSIKGLKDVKVPKISNIICFTIYFAIGIMASFSFVYATATVSVSSAYVSYDNSNSGLDANTVKGALDELYAKAGKCPEEYICMRKARAASEISYLDRGKTVQEALEELFEKLEDQI